MQFVIVRKLLAKKLHVCGTSRLSLVSWLPHLLLQVSNVFPVVLLHLLWVLDNCVRMGLRIARNADAKEVTWTATGPK